jgi:hypothetical protein
MLVLFTTLGFMLIDRDLRSDASEEWYEATRTCNTMVY